MEFEEKRIHSNVVMTKNSIVTRFALRCLIRDHLTYKVCVSSKTGRGGPYGVERWRDDNLFKRNGNVVAGCRLFYLSREEARKVLEILEATSNMYARYCNELRRCEAES